MTLSFVNNAEDKKNKVKLLHSKK